MVENTAAPKYQLLAELGHGGMADVYLAVLKGPTDFTKISVLKRLRGHLAEDPDFLAMFLQEARVSARLNHPNVVHTFEVGNDGRHHFIAMEYLEGHPYSALLARVGRDKLDLALQLRILIEVLEGLNYAHTLKDFDGTPLCLVHRDVSPQNVFLTYDGQIKLLDFGIAKALDSAVETRTGVIKGKLSYMSPEQALGGELDRRSDLYSVGVMLWEAVAQKRRWKGLSNVQMMRKLVSADEPLDLPDLNALGLPAELESVIKKALARESADRYRDGLEFQAELEAILEKLGRVTSRDVGKTLAEVFAEDRARIQGIIETELKRLDTRELPTVRPGPPVDMPRIDLPPVSQSGSSITIESPAPTEHSAALSVPQPMPPSQQPRRGRFAFALLFAAAAAVAISGLVLHAKRQAAAQGAGEASAAQPAIQEISLRIAAEPAAATLYMDETRLGDNPHIAKIPRTDKNAKVRAELAGYETQERAIKLDSDVDVRIELKPLPEPAVADKPSAPGQKTARRYWGKGVAPAQPPTTEPAAQTEPAAPQEPALKKPDAPQKRTRAGVVLDTGNPWDK